MIVLQDESSIVLPDDDCLARGSGATTHKVVTKQRLPLDQAPFDASNATSLTRVGWEMEVVARIFIVPLWGPQSFRRFAVEIVLAVLSEPLFHAQRDRERSFGGWN